MWEHDLKYAAYLVAIGVSLNLAAPSKKWLGVFASLLLVSAIVFLCVGDIVYGVGEEIVSFLFAALCFPLSGLVDYLLTASLLKITE